MNTATFFDPGEQVWFVSNNLIYMDIVTSTKVLETLDNTQSPPIQVSVQYQTIGFPGVPIQGDGVFGSEGELINYLESNVQNSRGK
jgi:hypothetical protein